MLQGTGHGWSLPLLHMALSVQLWAIIVTQMCSNWAYYTLLTSLPTYMDVILHFDLQSVRFPFTCFMFTEALQMFEIRVETHETHPSKTWM